jgi:uncharacterized membrane protein YkvA (DUF1232 family)
LDARASDCHGALRRPTRREAANGSLGKNRLVAEIVVGVCSALAASWLAVTVALYLMRPAGQGAAGVLGFLPQVLRLMRALLRDPTVKRSARLRVLLAFVYNLQPINLIPDFIPVVGYLDNVVVTAWAFRAVVRSAGPEAVARHWQGSPQQLELLFKVARLPPRRSDRTEAA